MATDDWKRDLSEIIFSRMPIIAWTTLAITLGSIIIALWYPPTYEAKGYLILRSKSVQKSTESLNAPDVGAVPLSMHDLVSERQLLISAPLIQRTILALQKQGKIKSPADAITKKSRGFISRVKNGTVSFIKKTSFSEKDDGRVASDPVMLKAISSIQDALSVIIVPESTVINLRLLGRDPGRVEAFLDSLITEYLEYRLEVLHPRDQRDFYRERRDYYSKNLKEIEQKLVTHTDSASLADIVAEIDNNIELRMTLTQQKSDLRNNYIEQQQQRKMLEDALKNEQTTYFAFLNNVVLETLSEQLMALTIERGRAARLFKENSPQIVAFDENIASVSSELNAEVRSIHKNATSRQEMLMQQIKVLDITIASLKERTAELHNKAIEFQQISREADLLQLSYESFARRNEEAEISDAIATSDVSGDVTVLSRPAFSAKKIFPKLLLTPLLGLLVGLISGFSLAFLADFFDQTIRRASDVEKFASMHVIGSLRRVEKKSLNAD